MSSEGHGDLMKRFLEAANKLPLPVPSAHHARAPVGPSPTSPEPSDGPIPSSLSDIVKPDRAQAERFASVVFDGAQGFVNLRAIEEPAPEGRKAQARDYWSAIDADLPKAVGDYVEWCASNGFAAFLIPAPVKQGSGGLNGLLSSRFLVADIDKGDVAAKVGAMADVLGEPTMVVSSGGVTEDGQKRVHVYYRIAGDVAPNDLATLAAARKHFAEQFGADLQVGKNPAQILRCPGSLHRKSSPALARLEYVGNATYALSEISAKLSVPKVTPSADNYFDFSGDRPTPSVDRALTQPILSEGRSDDGLTRFEGASQVLGHFRRMQREGKYTFEEALAAAQDWNVAILNPPWPVERIDNEFRRICRIDEENHGPVTPPAAAIAFVPESQSWDASAIPFARERYFAEPPERRFVVDGMIPEGTAGVFAAVGDAGKSMMVLNLLNIVSSHPAPQSNDFGPAGINDTPCFFGRPIIKRGPAIYLTTEDTHDEISRRLRGLDPSGTWRNNGAKLITLRPEDLGTNEPLIREGKGEPACTVAFGRLRELILFHKPAIVAVDPLSTLVLGDLNSNALGAFTMKMFGALAEETGAAILAVHHFAKSTAPTNLSDARHSIRGAGALVDNGRWALALWEADEDRTYEVLKTLGRSPTLPLPAGVVYFGGLAKGNAPGEKTLRTLARDPANGLLKDVTEALRVAAPKQDEMDAAVYRALCAYTNEDPRFAFGTSEKTLEKDWGPVLRAAGLILPRAKLEATFQRLKSSKLLAATQMKRGSHILYAVVPG